MDGLAHAAGQGGPGGIALGHEGHELRPHLRADAAGQIQIQERADDILGTTHRFFSQEPGRVEGHGGAGSSGISAGRQAE